MWPILIILVVFGLLWWATANYAKASTEMWKKIHEFEKRTESASTAEEVVEIWNEAKEFCKDGLLKPYSDNMNVVAAVLKTKYHFLSKEKYEKLAN